ncbi:MAG: hypothetical protein SFV17_05290 [Candidatus Obscuribacter sp.]|nr:hypothetical protein [Candidatus Obscuribacter sp.]
MSFGRNLAILGALFFGIAFVSNGGLETRPPTWLPESSQFSRSRILMQPGLRLPEGCGAITFDDTFFSALLQNSGGVPVYIAATERSPQVFFDPEPKDLLNKLSQRVADSTTPPEDRLVVLLLTDSRMGCEVGIYARANGKSLREFAPQAHAALSNEATMTILRVAQSARNLGYRQVAADNQAAENLRNFFIILVVGGVVIIVSLVALTEWHGQRQIAASRETARQAFERTKGQWQERLNRLNLNYSNLQEFTAYIDQSQPQAKGYTAAVNVLGLLAVAGARRIEEISKEANDPKCTPADFQRLAKKLNDGFVLEIDQPWYEGSPFDPNVREIQLNLEQFEKTATQVYEFATRQYKSFAGIESSNIKSLLPPDIAE